MASAPGAGVPSADDIAIVFEDPNVTDYNHDAQETSGGSHARGGPTTEKLGELRWPERLRRDATITFNSIGEARRDLPSLVGRKLGGNASVASVREHAGGLVADIGITLSRLEREADRPLVVFERYPTVATLYVTRCGEAFVVKFPSYLAFAQRVAEVAGTRPPQPGE